MKNLEISPLSVWGVDYLKRMGAQALPQFLCEFSGHPLVFEFEQKIGHRFQNGQHLLEALCHRSFINEQQLGLNSNERLEFLGDSLLGALVTDELFRRHPELPEGELSKIRGALVNQQKLAQVAGFLQLSDMVLLGRGEYRRKGEEAPSILADCLEAIIAAIYLDSSLENCLSCLRKILLDFDSDFFSAQNLQDFDAKSRLQEFSFKYYKMAPVYRSRELVKEGRPYFEVELFIAGKLCGQFSGSSKKQAQKQLAQQVLNEVERTHAL